MRMSKTSSSLTLTLILTLTFLLNFSAANNLPSVTFASFDKSSNINFSLSESSSVNGEALQITPDSSNTIDYLVNKSGRIIYDKPFTLWNLTTTNTTTKKYVASFNTSFSVNVFRPHNASTVGEGLAFLIAPSLDGPPQNSYAGYLGLTNATLDADESNHFVAIELDTSKQSYDPDDNHVGLNINSIVSNATTSLNPLGIQISPENKSAPNYTIWIDYDGRAKRIYVYMELGNIRPKKPIRTVLDAALDIGEHVLEKSYFGFAGSTGSAVELNCVLSWNLTVEKIGEDDESSPPRKWGAWTWVLAIGLPILVAVTVILLLFWMVKRRKKVEDDPSMVLLGKLKSLPGTPREFEFKVLKKATNNFDEKMKLGQGGFGVVYKALIPGDDDTIVPVAVKKFSRESINGQDDFLQELIIINRLRHKHLVRLVGWCHKNDMLLLVYECMPNGSLDSHLFGDSDQPPLSWSHRYNILTGVASALRYLHNEFDQMVVHRDLKASNILLDSNFNAKLGDFGLARALDTDKTSYVDVELGGVPGTMGYIAPECFHTGKTTRESDVYAFGAVVLEVVCGRRPRCDIGGFQFLTDWVWMLHREGRVLEAVDPNLGKNFVEEDVERLLLLGLACSHPLPKERPLTAEIVQNISRSVAPVVVPPFKPAFVWPSMMPDMDNEDTTGNYSSKTSIAMTSSPYASSAGWTPRADDISDH